MSERTELLQQDRDAFTRLQHAITGLDDEQMTDVWLGTWGVREILIHISGWHRAMIPAFGRVGRGESPYPEGVSYDDFDAWNARFVEAARGAGVAGVVAELEAAHRDFVAAASALGDDHYAAGATARGLFEGAGPEHYREHTEQIRRWREGRAAA
jgi:hypothetical protein